MENNGVAIGVNKHDMSKTKVKRLSKVYRILRQHIGYCCSITQRSLEKVKENND